MTQTQGARNIPKAEEYEAKVKILGANKGKGSDAQLAFLTTFFEACYLTVWTLKKHTHGDGIDDAAHASALFAQEQGNNSQYDTKTATVNKDASNARTMGKLAGKAGFGPALLDVVNDFVGEIKTLRKNPAMKGKLKDGAQALVSFARAQYKADHIMTKQEFSKFLLKKSRDPMTEEDWLVAQRKTVQKHRAGKGGWQMDLGTADALVKLFTKRLKEIADSRQPKAA